MGKRRDRIVAGARAAAIAAFTFGAAACASEMEPTSGDPAPGSDVDPVELAIEALGAPIIGCDVLTAGTNGVSVFSGTGSSATYKLTLALSAAPAAPLVLSTKSGQFTANGAVCTGMFNGITRAVRTSDIKKIEILGSTANDKVIFDFLPGNFGSGVLTTTGGIVVDFTRVGAGPFTDVDSFMVRGGSAAETYRFLQQGTPATDIYIETSGDKQADIHIKPLLARTVPITISMGGGNDVVNLKPPLDAMDKVEGALFTATPVVTPLALATGVTAFGGLADDKFTSGAGDDAFYGGPGSDTFYAGDATDGADIYSGDEGVADVVDYSKRMNDLHVDLGPVHPAIEGTVNLSSPLLYETLVPVVANGLLNGKKLTITVDNKPVIVTFVTPNNPADLLSQINAAINLTFASVPLTPPTDVYATLVNRNHLMLMSNTNVPYSSHVKIEGDIFPAPVGAEFFLGFTPGVAATPQIAAPVLSTALSLGAANDPQTIAGGVLSGKRFVALVNGEYCQATLTNEVTVATAMATINTACTTQSTIDVATNQITLSKAGGSVTVLAGGGAYTVPIVPLLASGGAEVALILNTPLTGTLAGGLATLIIPDTTVLPVAFPADIAGKRLVMLINGKRAVANFTTEANLAAVVTTIDAAIDTVMGVGVWATATASSTITIGGTGVTSIIIQPGAAAYPAGTPSPALTALTAVDANPILGLAAAVAAGPYKPFAPGASGFAPQSVTGNVDLVTSRTYPAYIANARLVARVNGGLVQLTLTTQADAAAVITAINAAFNTALGTIAKKYATLALNTNFLNIDMGVGGSIEVLSSTAGVTGFSTANVLLGVVSGNAKNNVVDADDGETGEHDDVRGTVENIIGGRGNDELFGNDAKNTIKGGTGNDVIASGGNLTECDIGDGDSMLGEAGDDTFLMPMFNCRAIVTGGEGTNAVDFSGRTVDLILKVNSNPDDGEITSGTTTEFVNIGSDTRKLIGGFGADIITGGVGDDTLIGGPGADKITGGMGSDTVDYSSSPYGLTVTLCFDATVTPGCAADDGATGVGLVAGETDTINLVEQVVGSSFIDDISGAAAPAKTSLVLAGGAGNDTLTGGPEGDVLWGQDGDDIIHGGAGDDQITGDAGDDTLDGGDGDGDICLEDSTDTTPKIFCEL